MPLWVPGYEQIPITGCTGPGSYVNSGYPWRIVLHTTESAPGSIDGVIGLFKNNPCSTPHFCIDPGNFRKVQFIPMDWSAAALRGGRNGYETNRGHAIQVEIVGRANDVANWSDGWLKFVGEWIADVIKAGIPINLDNHPPFSFQGTVAIENSPYRFSPEQWKNFDGVCGHIHVPFNDHYDPYNMNIEKVIAYAKQALGSGYTPQGDEFDMASLDDLRKVVREELASDDVKEAQRLTTIGAWENDTRNILKSPVVMIQGKPHQFVVYGSSQGVVKQWIEDGDMRTMLVRSGFIADTAPRVLTAATDVAKFRALPTVGKVPTDF